MATQGYFPTSQSWAPGKWGCGIFLLALLLCVFLIGFLVLLYLIFVSPDGVLTVTYELRAASVGPAKAIWAAEKTCPNCAEQVKEAARVCRFCGYKFSPDLPVE